MDIEIVSLLSHAVEHEHVERNRVVDLLVEPQRHRYARHEIGAGLSRIRSRVGLWMRLAPLAVVKKNAGYESVGADLADSWSGAKPV